MPRLRHQSWHWTCPSHLPSAQTVGSPRSETKGEMGIQDSTVLSREGVGPFLGSGQCIGVV